ncbi:MAG: hypothetical protein HZB43_08375 [candidate division Zixibacteria bacterium]|nr:hypothetical protein [candidate division Zixibacteria bacterium]
MRFDRLEYIQNEFPGSPNTLVIDGNGQVGYESHSNEATPKVPEIGTWRMSLRADTMDTLRKLLDSPPINSLPDHWGRLRPGEDSRRIRVVAGSDTVEKLVGYREPVDPGMQKVIDALDQIVVEAQTHPLNVMRIALEQPSVSPDRVLSITLSLSNPGSEPLTCRNVATMIGESDGQLSFQAWPDKPRSELKSEELLVLSPTSIKDTSPDGNSRSTPACLELLPGKSISRLIRLPFASSTTGGYLIRAVYMNPATQLEGHPVLAGELYSLPIPVTIP